MLTKSFKPGSSTHKTMVGGFAKADPAYVPLLPSLSFPPYCNHHSNAGVRLNLRYLLPQCLFRIGQNRRWMAVRPDHPLPRRGDRDGRQGGLDEHVRQCPQLRKEGTGAEAVSLREEEG